MLRSSGGSSTSWLPARSTVCGSSDSRRLVGGPAGDQCASSAPRARCRRTRMLVRPERCHVGTGGRSPAAGKGELNVGLPAGARRAGWAGLPGRRRPVRPVPADGNPSPRWNRAGGSYLLHRPAGSSPATCSTSRGWAPTRSLCLIFVRVVGWLMLLSRSTPAHHAGQADPRPTDMRIHRRTVLGSPLNQYQPTA